MNHQHAPDRSTLGSRVVTKVTAWAGSGPVIAVATLLVVAWSAGLLYVEGSLDNQPYQLILNSVTSIVTFLMVFVIQSAQNRDSRAMQAKLDVQSRVLSALARRMKLDDPDEILELIGLEEAPERHIQAYQHRVRNRGYVQGDE
ncbi:low affinity iron permease family protein [Amycolatopsis cynarae]|uniref:Low affinity iron permease family protein n=1 Tax=Amycolatopsis cynarae TaxID=2995223 RepID=A0ABY7AVG4_9PSEU|nr:low affinity iron permease family protein [Amycolatopsis sp. HUAS 11-8]WAL63936.1 low affinity iron permease family protein [Amycolatopsis sp. HUAS 11-8]